MKSGKRNITAWLDKEQLTRLSYITKKAGGSPSASYVLGKLIEAEYDRLIGNIDPLLIEKDTDDIYKVLIAISKGEKFMDMDSIHAFLKGGVN